MLRRNWEGDVRHGIASQFLVFFEPDDRRTERVRALDLTWRSTIGQARQRFRQRLPSGAEVVTYSNVWGLPFFADLDGANRRIGILHGPWPDQDYHVRSVRGCLDGVIAISSPQMELAARLLPELTAERIAFLPVSAGRRGGEARQAPLPGRPLVVGYSGRVQRQQKRADRFPQLIEELDRAGLDYRFEILGDGSLLPGLRRRFRGRPHVIFHGRRQGDEYSRVLRGWDATIFVSDFEGMPGSLLEGLSFGVIPVYPRIGSGADAYVDQLAAGLLYPPGDLAAAARTLVALAHQPNHQIQELRERCGKLVQPHLGECDLEAMAVFLRRIAQLPRISQATFPPRPFFWSDHYPFGLLRRIFPSGLWSANSKFQLMAAVPQAKSAR
jgi:glycosyltransferase involved in cell wall biosynthesis